MGKIILGVNHSHNAGVAIIKDDKIVSVINEERLNGVKNYWGFPELSLLEIIKQAKIKPEEIDIVAVCNLSALGAADGDNPTQRAINIYEKQETIPEKKLMYNLANYKIVETMFFSKMALLYSIYKSKEKKKEIFRKLRDIGIVCPIEFIEHHHAHACSAYYTSHFDDCLVYTSDFVGDFISGTVYICKDGKMKRIKEMPFYPSPGMIYTWITYMLGFTPGKHEGKVTGLAAYGNPDKTYEVFCKYLNLSKSKDKFIRNIRGFWYNNAIKMMKKDLEGCSREDIAAGLQKRFEEVVSENINHYIKKTGKDKIALAGGIFANVRLNQKILELDGVKEIFIHPAMDDGGLALGAALVIHKKHLPIDDVFFGPEYSDEDIKEVLDKENLKYKYMKNIEKEIAKRINQNKVVARFDGRMEYGPRALGNRSILYNPKDRSVNDWLNERLNRTEFMPFAPATLEEYEEEAYKNIKAKGKATNFMTITFDVTDKFAKECPAVTHLDGTARPQIISKKDNPNFHKIIDEYRKLTGIPTIVNTSFNMHEHPIVMTPEKAVASFMEGKLDYLAIGNYLVGYKENKKKGKGEK